MENQNNSVDFNQAFEYHQRCLAHFKGKTKTWDWFKDVRNQEAHAEKLKTDLLKNAYRLDQENYQHLYDWSKEIVEKLNCPTQIILYQENHSQELNTGIISFEKESHIIFSGEVIDLLGPEEFKALLAHELGHLLFYRLEEGAYETCQIILNNLANHPEANEVHVETAKRYQLYLELFCDRVAYFICESYEPVISLLVKLNTGLRQVNVQSYLNQAKEVLENSNTSKGTSHPETYIRSVALELLAQDREQYKTQLNHWISGSISMDALDIFDQEVLKQVTRYVLGLMLKPKWMQTERNLMLCRSYFDDFQASEMEKEKEDHLNSMTQFSENSRTYLSYVLLDAALADSDLEKLPIVHALEVSEMLGIQEEMKKSVCKELNLSEKAFGKMLDDLSEEFQKIVEQEGDSIYKE